LLFERIKGRIKFLYVALCLAWIPVFLEATCSGIQHLATLATLLLDPELATKVNLIPQTNSDDVQDIYTEKMVDINKAINNYGELNPEFSYLGDVKLTRDI
jgi:DNA-directed RNA polymerase